MCGGTIEFEQGASVGVCDSCGTRQTLPRLDDDRKANLYDRANHFRRNNDFDKAMGIYEQILNEDSTDAETYWSLVLCRYGIEYVEDPATHKRVPTVNRTQFTSIFADEDYKSALQYADGYQKAIYEEEARAIDEIQRGILEISQKEEPFDVFISYKETDESGRRTRDSVLANDLYHQLTQEGFKVFFSRITLEDKLGTAYEPYIFAALNSAKVMVVLGTKPEYFRAVWMKNEWSRYLALIKNGAKKTLIPAYRDMDPYDLPEEFSHLQAQDMSKLGFMQDLIRGIKKIIGVDAQKAAAKETVVIGGGNANTAALLKRAFMFLEDGEWQRADEFCEQVLNQEPENAQAYLGKLMAELHVRKQESLKDCKVPFDNRNNYQKTLRFAEPKLSDALKGYISFINERNEKERVDGIYDSAVRAMQSADTEKAYQAAAAAFHEIPGFKDADSLAEQCLEKAEVCRKNAIYDTAKASMTGTKAASYEAAIKALQTIPGWKDADELVYACRKTITEFEAKAETDRKEAEARAKRRKRTAIIAAAAVCAVTAFIIVLITVIIPNGKYKDAVSLMDSGDYEEAIAAFTALDGYKDSAAQIDSCKYSNAVALMSEGRYEDAITAFTELEGYKDSAAQIDSCYISIYGKDVYNSIKNSRIGGTYTFGTYEQDNIAENGKEAIEWIVADKDGLSLCLVSKYALDCLPYKSSGPAVPWETCSLRTWLNSTFINTAFSSEEQALIATTTISPGKEEYLSNPSLNDTQDKVFLLSTTEADEYFPFSEEKVCVPTEYAIAQGADTGFYDVCDWWLRPFGYNYAYVYKHGEVRISATNGINNDSYGVRPALWITLDP